MRVCDLLENFDRFALHDLSSPESKEINPVKSDEHLVDILNTQCSIMVEAYRASGNVLYRGLSDEHKIVSTRKISTLGNGADIIVTGIRTDRKPVQMNAAMHQILVDAFKRLGLSTNRKNGIFTSTQVEVASTWGTAYVVFVKDGWKGLVFEGEKHDYSFYNLRDFASKNLWNDEYTDKKLDLDIESLRPLEFNSAHELARILKEKYLEVLISGDSYIAISKDYFYSKIAPLLEKKK